MWGLHLDTKGFVFMLKCDMLFISSNQETRAQSVRFVFAAVVRSKTKNLALAANVVLFPSNTEELAINNKTYIF